MKTKYNRKIYDILTRHLFEALIELKIAKNFKHKTYAVLRNGGLNLIVKLKKKMFSGNDELY